jgi:hypothetical protein
LACINPSFSSETTGISADGSRKVAAHRPYPVKCIGILTQTAAFVKIRVGVSAYFASALSLMRVSLKSGGAPIFL